VRIIEKVIEQGNASMIYLAGPLLAASQDPSCKRECFALIDRMLGGRLGGGEQQALDLLTGSITGSFRDPERREHAVRIAEKLIDEGYIPLIKLLGPLTGAMRSKEQRSSALTLLRKMKREVSNGRLLGDGGEDANARAIGAITACMHSYGTRKYKSLLQFFKDQMRREGIMDPNGYEGPSLRKKAGRPAVRMPVRALFSK
jgi:hypothetical protein